MIAFVKVIKICYPDYWIMHQVRFTASHWCFFMLSVSIPINMPVIRTIKC